MTNRDIAYTEAKSPLMTADENLNFRQFQLYIYRTVYNMMQMGFSRANFIEKLKILAGQLMSKSNEYYICNVVDMPDSITVTFYAKTHPMSKAVYEITYDEL